MGDRKEDGEGSICRTILVIVVTNAVAIKVDSLGLTVTVAGAVGATLIMYVLPALMYMKSSGGVSALPLVTLILGCIIGMAGVTTSIMVGVGMTSDLHW